MLSYEKMNFANHNPRVGGSSPSSATMSITAYLFNFGACGTRIAELPLLAQALDSLA